MTRRERPDRLRVVQDTVVIPWSGVAVLARPSVSEWARSRADQRQLRDTAPLTPWITSRVTVALPDGLSLRPVPGRER